MKLLLYSHFFAPSIGGVETVVASLTHGLANYRGPRGNQEFEITLVTQTPRGEFQDSSLPFCVVRTPSTFQLRRLIQEADVIHVAGAAIAPIVHGLLAGKPVVVEHHGFQATCPTGQMFQEPENLPCTGHFMAGRHANCLRCGNPPRRVFLFRLWLLTFVRRFLCRRVTVNITPTEWLAGQLQLPRSQTVPHGLPAATLVRIRTDRQSPALLFIGRLVTTKGVRVLLDAMRILKEKNYPCELHIVGDGPEGGALQSYANEAGLAGKVQFLGRLPQPRILELLARTDLVIVPSLAGEVFGMVVAENMLLGVPVMASDLGSFREILGETGKTFKTGDASDLAGQIARLLENSPESQRLALAARKRVLDFYSLGSMIEKHARIFRQLFPVKDSS